MLLSIWVICLFPLLAPGSCNTCLTSWFSSVGWKHLSECCFPGRDTDLGFWTGVCWSALSAAPPSSIKYPINPTWLTVHYLKLNMSRIESITFHHTIFQSFVSIAVILWFFISRTIRLFLTPLVLPTWCLLKFLPHLLLWQSQYHLKIWNRLVNLFSSVLSLLINLQE